MAAVVGGLSPHEVDRILTAALWRGITEKQLARINATLDQWQQTIRTSDLRRVVEKYQRVLHVAVSRLHTISLLHNENSPDKVYLMLRCLALIAGIGVEIDDLNKIGRAHV